MLIIDDQRVYPVEFKASAKIASNVLIQLQAYAYLAEKKYSRIATGGFVVARDRRKTVPVKFRENWRVTLIDTLKKIQHLHKTQCLPSTRVAIEKCLQCEYLQRCNDRI
jgi:CRISPR-associated exonuclease Cas4